MASNSDSDLYPYKTSPRFLLNSSSSSSHISGIHLAPLGPYAQGYTRSQFAQSSGVTGNLLLIDASNANEIDDNSIVCMSCDESAYASGNLNPTQVFDIVFSNPQLVFLILYSQVDNHCNVSDLDNLSEIGSVFTTVGSSQASRLANYAQSVKSPIATIVPDLNSFTNSSGNWDVGTGLLGPSPTTAVAMIILYSITGVITALFVLIIVTGAIRAHRHPERYGPRNISGRGRQSRAKGIARAMLETLPIVKFGELDAVSTTKQADIEMNDATVLSEQTDAVVQSTPATESPATAPGITTDVDQAPQQDSVTPTHANADGTDAEGHLGCSICTEDFNKGEEVRVLPCNHKFHPECVDPWLLNVSGTCPLCRIDLRPKESDEEVVDGDTMERQGSDSAANVPPPLEPSVPGSGRRDTMLSLRGLTSVTREERIAALRRLRDERRRRGMSGSFSAEGNLERRRLRDRLRDRFRIRTMAGSIDISNTTGTSEEDTMRRFDRLERQEELQRRASAAGQR